MTIKAYVLDGGSGKMERDPAADFEKPCECWGCSVCGPVKARQYLGHFTDVFSKLPDVAFATLTIDPKIGIVDAARSVYIDPETGGPNLGNAELAALADELRRRNAGRDRFVASALADRAAELDYVAEMLAREAERLAQANVELLTRKYLQHTWSKWRKRLNYHSKKSGGGGLKFMRVIEPQKSGVAHAHALISAPGVTPDEAAAAWFECGGGLSCEIEPITGSGDELARRVGYATKYALKEAQSGRSPKGRHYVETSEGTGYGSAVAVHRRAAHVAAERGEEPPPPLVPRPERVPWRSLLHSAHTVRKAERLRSGLAPAERDGREWGLREQAARARAALGVDADWWDFPVPFGPLLPPAFGTDRTLRADGGKHRVYVTGSPATRGPRLDTITAADLELFEGLDPSARTTQLHTFDEHGEWWRVQYEGGKVVREPSPDHRSLFQKRMEAAAGPPLDRAPP